MDRLAAALGMDPVALRLKNALETGDRIATTNQLIVGEPSTREVIESVAAMPPPIPGFPMTRTPPRRYRADDTAICSSARHRACGGDQESGVFRGFRRLRRGAPSSPSTDSRCTTGERERPGNGDHRRTDRPNRQWDRSGHDGGRRYFSDWIRGSTSASRQTQMTGGAGRSRRRGGPRSGAPPGRRRSVGRRRGVASGRAGHIDRRSSRTGSHRAPGAVPPSDNESSGCAGTRRRPCRICGCGASGGRGCRCRTRPGARRAARHRRMSERRSTRRR